MSEDMSLMNLITKFRTCKTQAEEREFFNKERGEIRNNMKDWDLE